MISAYFRYSIPTNFFTERLGHILGRIGDRVVIGADVNAHAELWHSRRGNNRNNNGWARGNHVVRLVEEFDLMVHNRAGQLDTYLRHGIGSSNIDVTFTRGEDLRDSIGGWETLDDVTDSDHRLIRFKVSTGWGAFPTGTEKLRYNVRKADWDRFRCRLTQG